VVEALNVKTALFFLAFLPQFVSPDDALVPQLVLLGSICVALNTLVDVVAVFAADRMLKSNTARAMRAQLLTRVSGVTMLGLARTLALARREPGPVASAPTSCFHVSGGCKSPSFPLRTRRQYRALMPPRLRARGGRIHVDARGTRSRA